ncbi:MarR family winged helix-turn-helix transcriptional regulator [Streptomyces sp. NPDC098789]|uniref:MarR family winged helix-turn-helix transcriptional regulator n=1 Tax=Streptomyces sp. NPDC098789 TaxID=3366098 RepID=UPI00380A6D4A
MEYSHDDAELVEQPIGYWSWAAYEAVVTRTRGALAEIGTTQPQWWVLGQVALAEKAKSRTEVIETLQGYLTVGAEAVSEEIDTAIARGWLTQDTEGVLGLTPHGRTFFDRAAALQGELWTERHEGISDEEYRTTLKVLQRFIHNVGGRAWHH